MLLLKNNFRHSSGTHAHNIFFCVEKTIDDCFRDYFDIRDIMEVNSSPCKNFADYCSLVFFASCVQIPYSSPVATSSYPFLGTTLVASGLVVMAGYFVYQMRGSGKRNIIIELLIGALSSVLLGFGTLFMMLSFGLYV